MSSRSLFFIGFLLCASMIAVAGYFQFIKGLEPCPLCSLQRMSVLLVGIVFLLATLQNPKSIGIRIYGFFITVLALAGAAVSAWHIRLQNLPEDQVPDCGPGLNFMLDNFPLSDAIDMIFRGSGECAEVLWTFVGISIPGWTLAAFVLLTAMGSMQLFRTIRSDYF